MMADIHKNEMWTDKFTEEDIVIDFQNGSKAYISIKKNNYASL